MTRREFETIVEGALEELPKKFKEIHNENRY